jgi:hypothetical protein
LGLNSFNKTEFIAVNTGQRFHINLEENVTIKQVQNVKYLGVTLHNEGMYINY